MNKKHFTSEIVNKRRRLDSVIDRNSDFLSRQGADDSASGNSFMNMMMIYSNQRDIRNEEHRREDAAKEARRQVELEEKNKKEETRVRAQVEREEQRQRDKDIRDDMRRKDDLDREERREKADKERTEMMMMFLSKK